ncbi:hypothetical protein L2E82_13980 [Cichorium intybus]|uniref:Uncharacterized protein n=1 Tax=Cichorium intybus TaxID=13427 RepID=A0ACB9EYQ2_CICIN|nr:hypothetical protein L1887_33613 [Cichorium endivia]KAI3763982.1 hypothetical protein L2E82_13980 [Cichorium intybus]
MMAEQCNENSVATSSSAAKWWPDVHTSSLGSWTGGANYANNPPCTNLQDHNSNCSGGDDDVSISTSFTTNASNNSGLSMESSRLVEKASTTDLYGEAVSDNHHLWNQVFLGVGTTGELQNISTRMFEPACDYLKKMDSGWEFTSPANHNQFQKNINGFNDSLYQSKNPSLVSSWSIAPPETSPQFDPYSSQFTVIKNEHTESDIERGELLRRGLSSHAVEYTAEINDMAVSDNNKYYYNGLPDLQCANGRGFVDLVAFGCSLNKPPSGTNMCNKPVINTMNLPDHRTSGIHGSYQPIRARGSTLTKMNARGNGVANEGKRKKSEDQSGSLIKKPKVETSTVSSTKVQLPKAKLGDKITALQQIVSPFGKTDTASVLWEAIGYIKCLQEQVQLLSNPYMKTNIIKDTWVRFEAKDRGDAKLDLKSRGLCLVPTSCTPQVYHENNGSDYWTPTYRGCFYR